MPASQARLVTELEVPGNVDMVLRSGGMTAVSSEARLRCTIALVSARSGRRSAVKI